MPINLSSAQLPSWSPPETYQPVHSALEGVTVYAPRPTETAPPPTANFKCPNCGATTRYDVAGGGVACEHCGYTIAVQAEKVGQRADESEFTLETVQQAEQGWGTARKELHCESCGASLTLAEKSITTTCPFCASNQVNVRAEVSEALRPRFIIPFKVQAEAVQAQYRAWLGQGWFHPTALAQSATANRFVGIYLPFWTFDARITSHWKAEVGYERQESYYDSDSKSWKTRTEIDWRWENGTVPVVIDDLLISGSSRLSRTILERLYPFNLKDLMAYTPDYLAGWQAQAYDVTLTKAWDDGKTVMRDRAKQAARGSIRSGHVRNFSMTADFADETWRYILLPVYVAAYKFNNKTYQVMANGQTGLVAGQKPVDWNKLWVVFALLLAPVLCLGLIGFPLLLVGGAGAIPLGLGGIWLIIALVIMFSIYQQAVASEAG